MQKILNADQNMKLVADFGDDAILREGLVCSNYAKFINTERLEEFCEDINSDLTFRKCGFELSVDKDLDGKIKRIELYRNCKIKALIKLLDYTIYCETTEKNWPEVSGYSFNFILYSWRRLLAKYIPEYRDQYNKTIVMSRMDNVSIL